MRGLVVGTFLCLVFAPAASAQGAKSGALLVGKWETPGDVRKMTLDFSKDGKFQFQGDPEILAFAFKFMKVYFPYDINIGFLPLTYRLPEAGKLEVEADLSKLVKLLKGDTKVVKKYGGDPKTAKVRDVAKIAVNKKELTITGADGKSLTLRRVK
jgi:hypothetical protein